MAKNLAFENEIKKIKSSRLVLAGDPLLIGSFQLLQLILAFLRLSQIVSNSLLDNISALYSAWH